MKKFLNKKIIKNLVWTMICILYFLYLFFIVSHMSIDSDYSNLILEANDILSGNIFLSDWNLTGISFITTDVLAFIVGVSIFGISIKSYYIAVTIMIFLLNISGFLLIRNKENNIMNSIIYVAICAIPSPFAITVLRAHTMSAVYSLLAIIFIEKIRRGESKKRYFAIYILLIALGTCGDSVALIIAVLPILLYELAILASKKNDYKYSPYIIIASTILGTIIGFILDKIYFVVGGANKNSFLESKSFIILDQVGDKFQVYFDSLFKMFNADFWGNRIVSIYLVEYFINSLIIIISLAIVLKSLWKFFHGKEEDYITGIISLSVLFMTIIFVLTDISVDIHSSRYMAYFTTAFSILIVRNIGKFIDKTLFKKKIIMWVIIIITMFSSTYKFYYWVNVADMESSQCGLVEFLLEKGLTNGLGCFWDASSTTVLSNNEIQIRSVYFNESENKFDMYNWFCKNEWYDEDTYFIVTTEDNIFGVISKNVIAVYGEPKETLVYQGWNIFVYNQNLSEKLIINN